MEFPQGVFGISLFTYLLATLSGFVAEKNYDQFRTTLNDGLHYLSFLNIFAAVFTLIMAEPVVRLIFEGGEVGRDSSHRVSLALMSLAPSLIAFSFVGSYSRGFYALGDVKTPMFISIFCLILNLILAMILIHPFRQAGLGIANSISSWVNFALLTYAMRLKLKRLDWGKLPLEIGRMALAAIIAAQVIWALNHYWLAPMIDIPNPSLILKILAVFIPMIIGFSIYWAICSFLNVRATTDILSTIKGALTKKK